MVRLALPGYFAFFGYGFALAGLFGSLLAAAVIVIGTCLSLDAEHRHSPSPKQAERKKVISYVKTIVPSVTLYAVLEPAILWLVSVFGGRSRVAETFALGRIGMMFAFLGGYALPVVLPKLARISDESQFARMAAVGFIAIAAFAGLFLAALTAKPHQVLGRSTK